MGRLYIARNITLCASLVIAAIVLGLSGSLLNGFVNMSAQLGSAAVAISITAVLLTIITVPVLFMTDFFRKRSWARFTTTVWFESIWLNVLSIFWSASGALSPAFQSILEGCIEDPECNFRSLRWSSSRVNIAISAFSFLNAFALFCYGTTLFVFALLAARRGNDTWSSTVRDADFFAPFKYPTSQSKRASAA